MQQEKIKIAMNGVTGRMGTNQHLVRSIMAIREQGGVDLGGGRYVMPEPVLVGRNESKLAKLSALAGGVSWTTSLEEVLADPEVRIYFDAQTTTRRVDAVIKAIEAGKDVYCEKPTAMTTDEAYGLYEAAVKKGVKHGVVQDKLWLPGLCKLRMLKDSGFFGEILSVRGEFGYWVFEGDLVPAQRPSWNYRKEDGGGIIVDMLCHWRYVLADLFGEVESVSCLGATHIPHRVDESGKRYVCTADDSAYATFQLASGVIAHMNSSWCVRVRRDDLLTLQVDGTRGTAIAGLRGCRIQRYESTPKPVWNPDIAQPIDFYDGWSEMPDVQEYDNAFKVQWEMFIRHVAADDPYTYDLLAGAKGVQLAEKGLESWEKRAWVDVDPLPKLG
jgi:predicted dehydrogenase